MTAPVPIWFEALHVGDIDIAADGAMSLRYAGQWLESDGAFPLSVTMPLREEFNPSRVIFQWLANLLPEGKQLQALARVLGVGQTNVLSILREIGGDTAGALSFEEPSIANRWTYTPLTVLYGVDDEREALEHHFSDLPRRPLLVGEEGVRQSLAGGQTKSAIAVLGPDGAPVLRLPEPGDTLAVPRHGAPSTLIVKPDNPDLLPGVVENETWCLTMAQAIGIDAARATVLQGSTRTAIGVLRYDRKLGGDGRIRRVHQEDFAQANGIFPWQKYEQVTPRGLDLKTLLETGGHVGAADALALLDQVIFNILVANADAHAKNYALLLPVANAPRLAPLYDVSTVLPWPHITQIHAQNIAGKKRMSGDVAGRHWDAIAYDVGNRPADVRARVRELVDLIVANKVRVTEEVAALPGAATGYVAQAAEAIEANALRIVGRL